MRETHDTVDGLLAEFRGYSAGMPPSYHVTMSWADFRKMLDRFDAANKREVQNALDAGGFVEASRKNKQVGDAAKLREVALAMLDMIFEIQNNHRSPLSKIVYAVRRKVKAALAAPARNCDTKEPIDSIVKRFKAENCDQYDNAWDDPRTQCHQNCVECIIKWMMANQKEVSDGSK